LQFIPGTFIKEQYGELRIDFSLKNSLILTNEEAISLFQITESKDGILLYRATMHGFESEAFHEKCDGKENTLTIIKTDGNYVFGGYTAAKWSSDKLQKSRYIADTKAFIFSKRRDGVSCNHKFMVENANNAIFGNTRFGPTFGHDIVITDKSNTSIGSWTNLGNKYHYPPENGDGRSFLAGSYDQWLTTEIEVYQIEKFIC
jgi:hypothetical protein